MPMVPAVKQPAAKVISESQPRDESERKANITDSEDIQE